MRDLASSPVQGFLARHFRNRVATSLFSAFRASRCLSVRADGGLVRQPLLKFFGDINYRLCLIHLLVFVGFVSLVLRFLPQLATSRGHCGVMTIRLVISVAAATGLLQKKQYAGQRIRHSKARPPLLCVPPNPDDTGLGYNSLGRGYHPCGL